MSEVVTPRVEISTIASGSEAGSSPEDEGGKVPGQRRASKSKLLVRSHAIREATSPPPDSLRCHSSNEHRSPISACVTPEEDRRGTRSRDDTLTYHNDYHPPWKTTRAQVPRFRLKHQGSSQDSNSSLLSSVSRDPSQESPYTDNTGIDLQQFIVETLHRNQKDRLALMKMEQEMVALVKDPKRTHHKFPPMSSYHRMLVHRVGAYFGLEHNVDQSGNAVIVNKTRGTRIADPPFRDLIRENVPFTDSQLSRKSILKRDSSSFEDSGTGRSPNRQLSLESRSGKSFEDRESDYERARIRNFGKNRSWSSCDAGVIEDYAASPIENEEYYQFYDERNLVWRLGAVDLSKQNPGPAAYDGRNCRLLKVESLDSHEMHTLSKLRPAVSKSYSFGGYTGNGAVQSGEASTSQTTQILLKQDSDASNASVSRLSPSSSGYKSNNPSDGSTGVSANTSPTPAHNGRSRKAMDPRQSKLAEESSQPNEASEEDVPFALWAISSLDSVPEGSVLINPATGRPFTNPDGTIYRYDSQRPLPFPATFKSASVQSEDGVQNPQHPSLAGFSSLPTSPEGFQPNTEPEQSSILTAPENGYYQGYIPSAGYMQPTGNAYVALQAVPMPPNATAIRLVDQASGLPTNYAFLVPGYSKFRQPVNGYPTYCEERQMEGQPQHVQQVSVTSNGSIVCYTPADGMAQQPQAVMFPSYAMHGQAYDPADQQQYAQEGVLSRPTHLPIQTSVVPPAAGYVFRGNQGMLASNLFIRTSAPHYRPIMPHFIRPRVPHSVSYSQPGPSGVYYPSSPYNGSQFRPRKPVKSNTLDIRPEFDTSGQQLSS